MVRSDQISQVVQKINEILSSTIEASGIDLVPVESLLAHRPHLTLLHPEVGVIALEIAGEGEEIEIVRMRLNDKVARFQKEASLLDSDQWMRISILRDSDVEQQRIGNRAWFCGLEHLGRIDRSEFLSSVPLDNRQFAFMRDLLIPRLAVEIPVYGGIDDGGRDARRAKRIELDEIQSNIAKSEIEDVLLVEGGPGTGKTLALVGRAKWLAEQHPEWKILLVVYNNILLKFLRSIPDVPESVRIVTLKRFLEVRNEKRLARLLTEFDNPDSAEVEASKILSERTFTEDDIDIDALLVDEWQDFKKPFLQYLLMVLRKQRGGAMFVGDANQAIYTDGFSSPFRGRNVKKLSLDRPYRSTKPILRVATALDPDFGIPNITHALDGEPVTVIYAKHWSLQGDVIALEIRNLLETGRYTVGEIAVLCTTRSGAQHVGHSLNSLGIENHLLTKFWEDPELVDNAVNVMTVHGSKGIGFSVVFLQGFETLKDRNGTPETAKWRRVGFVGATRAQDLLYIVYREPTQFVSSVLDLGAHESGVVVGRLYPEDYKKLS